MADTTAVAIYKLGLDNQQYLQAAQAQISVSNQLVAAQEKVAVSEEKAGGASLLAANAMQRRIERNTEGAVAERKFAEAMAFSARAAQEGRATAEQRAIFLEQETAKLNTARAAIEAKAKAQRDAAQAERDAEAAAKNLARIEGEHALALKNSAAALGVDQAALIAAANAGNRHAAATLDMMNKIVGLNKALQEGKLNLAGHAQEIDRVQQAYRSNVTAIATQEAAMKKSATATGLARYELINLSRQFQDIGVSLAGGQSPLRIIVEQGSQIADVFISSKAKISEMIAGIGASIRSLGVGGAITGIFTGIIGGIAAIGGTILSAAVNFGSAQRDIQQSLLGIGRAAGVTSRDIQGIAEMSATTFGASISEAREFAAALAQSGTLGNASIRDLTLVSKELAQVLGTDVAGAGKQLQQIFTDPVAGLQRLDKEMGTFDRGVAHTVETLTAQGKVFQASEVAAKALTDRMKELGPEIQRTTSFWTAFGNTVSDWWTKLGQFAARRFGFGLSIEEELERAEQALNDANQFFQQTGLGREMVEEAVTNFNRLTKILETMGKTAEDIRRSRDVGATKGIVQDIIPDIANMQKLKNEAAGLRAALEKVAIDPKFAAELQRAGISTNALALALNRVQGASGTYLATQERLTAQFELQLASIRARTDAERQAVAAQESALASAGQNLTTSEARLASERAVTLEIERQAQTHRDNMAALEDQLRIAQARTESEQLSAQYEADINARLREGATLMQAEEEAAMKRKIAEEGMAQKKVQAINQANEAQEKHNALVKAEEIAQNKVFMQLGIQLREMNKLAASTDELVAKLGTIGTGFAKVTRDIGNVNFADIQSGPIAAGGGLVGAAGMSVPLSVDLVGLLGRGLISAINNIPAMQMQTGMQTIIDAITRSIDSAGAQAAQQDAAKAAEDAANAQQEAARAAQDAAKAQVEAAKAAREATISALDEAVKDIIATKLLAGQSAQAVNMLIEGGAIQFGTASTRFQTQLDLYKRAGASNSQIAADIRAGVIGEGARPSELLDALDSLKDAVTANTEAQIGLSEFYTQQGDRLLGYRGFNVQRGGFGATGAGTATDGTGAIGGGVTGGMGGGMGGVVNVGGSISYSNTPVGTNLAYGYVWGFVGGKWVPGKFDASGGWAPLVGTELQTARDTMNAAYAAAGYVNPYKFADGGIMSGAGPVSLRSYQGGGIVNSPQIAMFGEAGPEAFVPLKGGAIPVKLTGNNDNKPTTVVNINAPLVNFMAEPTRDEVRESAFQASQMLRRAAFGG